MKSPTDRAMLLSSPVDGFRLAYVRRQGSGRPVMLLHGWPGDHGDWKAVLELLFPQSWSDRIGEFFSDASVQRQLGLSRRGRADGERTSRLQLVEAREDWRDFGDELFTVD